MWRESMGGKEYMDKYSKEYYKKTMNPAKKREAHLKSRFGITIDQYAIMLESQNGKCAICFNETANKKGKVFLIDHDHRTGRVRGLLCTNCNSGIGFLRDSVGILERAIKYIKQYAN